eukprot:TRINITY_DN7704_c0_g1_i1.p1 TRINITY_DN7704_c0_g1~~TRINITY_DN7704_c0_g1_i1.p1  ORF type:complete len:328 (+),score=62.55 TRINITY_DN7704_c0_g1_i1:28-1011(+)
MDDDTSAGYDIQISSSFKETWDDLTPAARVLLVQATVLTMFLVAFGAFSIVVGALQPDFLDMSKTVAYALVLIVSAIFLLYFAYDGVINENKYEVAAFLAVTYLLATRIGWMFITGRWIDSTRNLPLYIALNYAALAMFVLNVLFAVPNTIYTVRAWKSFGWKMYRNVGTDRELKEKFRVYQIFLSLLKVDLQFNISLVVLGGFFIFQNVANADLWVNIVMVIVTIVWTFLANYAIRQEQFKLFILVCAFAVVEPTYIIYKMVTLFGPSGQLVVDNPRILFAISGALSIAERILLFFFIVRCYRNWGPGALKNKVFDRIEKLHDDSH